MKMMQIDELRAGDVLLCYKDEKFDIVGKGITHVTGSEYTHAAICIDSCTAAESRTGSGVAKIKIEDLIKRYDHVAVFRQPDAWLHFERVQAMNAFIESIAASGAKYNLRDEMTFKKRSEVHQLSLTDQLNAFFNGTYAPAPIEKGSYFCSELVASCFVVTGFIDPSAAVVYKSDVTSPGALGRDPTFGTFFGYVSTVPNYSVPATDEFINHSTFGEIFGTKTGFGVSS
ncbi:hypothetical protein [Pseudomonas aeruginosa]|uniref:hypothetical protein n=1 Tax=Pseudomonas aeruginosa TaxID=287 RepID=UPI0012476605|nr:hypothetical protein [Pseudomonas aeruginosa]KAB0770039.1 hypothetical protein F7O98_05545 [Pseudomonas aeruginosa]KAB0783450.1 hypothetical protein F7O99_03985 [Pseudomonas aeruginosa]MBG5094601.1 hypothetical protein [Pseudomonas aeruginosa]MBG6847890.1 hypothetical protein [Pseudomonas aeruginosa]MBH9488170.1 hypothetical protein [Pseudomonas aeruginosa]